MEALLEEHEKLSRNGSLSKSVEDVQKTIDLLTKARDSIVAGTSKCLSLASPGQELLKYAHRYRQGQNSASVTLAKLQNPVKQSFETINNDLKDVYKGLGNYSKALDKVLLPSTAVCMEDKLKIIFIEIQRQAPANDRL